MQRAEENPDRPPLGSGAAAEQAFDRGRGDGVVELLGARLDDGAEHEQTVIADRGSGARVRSRRQG
jgi:hypothetical protein